MTNTDQHKFIFLCGLHRSGTSPLFRILREHPDISGFRDTGAPEDEGQHLQSVFLPATTYGGPGRFGFRPEAHLTETSPLVTLENRRRLFEEWSTYWDLYRPFLLEKSPPNLIRTRFLQALFPNSSFIVITRHPIAVSLATWKWSRSSLESLMKHWLHCHHLFELDRPHLRRALVIRYEDLVQTSDVTLEQIFRFLGVASHASPCLNPAGNERYLSIWRQLRAETRGHAGCRHIIAKYEKPVRAYGYTFTDCNPTSVVAPPAQAHGNPRPPFEFTNNS